MSSGGQGRGAGGACVPSRPAATAPPPGAARAAPPRIAWHWRTRHGDDAHAHRLQVLGYEESGLGRVVFGFDAQHRHRARADGNLRAVVVRGGRGGCCSSAWRGFEGSCRDHSLAPHPHATQVPAGTPSRRWRRQRQRRQRRQQPRLERLVAIGDDQAGGRHAAPGLQASKAAGRSGGQEQAGCRGQGDHSRCRRHAARVA